MAAPVPLETLSGLLKASARGDKRSFEAFYDATAFEALALAAQLAFERREELLARSYLQAWRDALRFDPERESAFDWLLAIVRQLARTPGEIAEFSSSGSSARR
jgi:RNA polymerase sigma-70 factor (ECF subfamily)